VRLEGKIIIFAAILSIIPFFVSEVSASPPDSPENLSADDVSPTQIDLQWTAPDDDGGSAILAYKIEFYIPGQGSCCNVLVADTGNANTQYSHTNAATGKTYIYQVSTINLDGTSEPSSQAVATTSGTSEPPEEIPPNPISGLTAVDLSPTNILVSWNAPTANNGPFVTGYKIERKVGSGSFTILVADTGSTDKTYTNSGLTTGTTYTYKVYAINSIDISNSTSEASATPTSTSTPPEGTAPPKTPKNFKASAVSNSEISLTWKHPEFDGPPVTSYKIEVKKTGESDFSDLTTTGVVTSYLHTNLDAGVTFTYRISAINSIGTSNTVQSSAVPQHTDKPTNFVATAVSPTKVELSWSAPSQTFGYTIGGYNIEEQIAIGVYQIVHETSGTITSATLTGLTTGETYTFRVFARIGPVFSQTSDEVSVTPTESSGTADTVPSPPTLLTITHDDLTVNNLSWGTPEDDGGKSITGYKIELKVDVGDWEIVKANTGSTSTIYSHTNIPSGTDYNYRVSAINSIGTGLGNAKSIRITEEVPESQLIEISTDKLSYLEGGTIAVSGKVSSKNESDQVSLEVVFGGDIKYINQLVVAQDGTFSDTITASGPKWAKNGIYTLSAFYGTSSSQTNFQFTLVSEPEPAPDPTPEPEPEPKIIPDFIDTEKDPQYYIDRYNSEASYKAWFDSNYPDYTMEEAISLAYPQPEPEPAPKPKTEPKSILDFVDPNKDPQYYIDRYNNEATYKVWFDRTFPDYTIEEAVGLALPEPTTEPKPVLDFVDPNEDPQYYIDRYNSEATYKAWFDRTFPDYTIQEAVGLSTSEEDLSEKCGPGTVFKNGACVVEKTSGGGGCLIATAAFGSELAPQVQFLREIRDNVVLNTKSGMEFMTAFNQFYYSFSPTIADFERENVIFKETVKMVLTPLLSSLSILNYVDIDSEEEMLGYGIGIIMLNIGMYFAAPVIVVLKLRKLKFN